MNSPLAYIGGKSKLSDNIIKMIPDHQAYCEVFAGAAWVFFRKEPSKYETINDLDSDLVVFYRVLQNHLEEFLRQFKWLLSSREWFEDWKKLVAENIRNGCPKGSHELYLENRIKGVSG